MPRACLAVLAALLLAAPAEAAERPTLADLEDEVVCPTCESTLEISDAPVADRMREFIRDRISAGDSKEEIKDALVEQFGPGVLASPRTSGFGLLAWALPLGGIAAAALVVAVLARRWSRDRDRGDGEPLEPDLERRLDDELARFEA